MYAYTVAGVSIIATILVSTFLVCGAFLLHAVPKNSVMNALITCSYIKTLALFKAVTVPQAEGFSYDTAAVLHVQPVRLRARL